MLKFTLTQDGQWLRLDESDDMMELRQLEISMTREVPNYHFLKKKAKYRGWDGQVHFLHQKRFLPVGLWGELAKMGREHGIDVKVDGLDRIVDESVTLEDFRAWAEKFFAGRSRQLRDDYQVESAWRIVRYGRSLQELATNAGKTLITFAALAWLREHGRCKKFLMVVPNTTLLIQGTEDFIEYGAADIGARFQQVHGESSSAPKSDANVVIGTYQSLVKRDAEWLAQFDVVFIDEAHQTPAKSIREILSKCTGAWRYRFGLSGTLVGEGKADHFTIQANIGPLVMKVGADYLFQKGYSTPLDVRVVRMQYLPDEARERLAYLQQHRKDIEGSKLYQVERRLVIGSRVRLNFVVDSILRTTKNSLVLFQSVEEEYGRQIYDLLRERSSDKEVFYIDGSTKDELREEYKDRMKTGSNRILVASFGTFSTGISIDNLHNIFLVESYKSEILIKQSLGRMMRTHDDKDVAVVFDFVDDFSWKGKPNYLMKHSAERIEIYKREKYAYRVYDVDLNKLPPAA